MSHKKSMNKVKGRTSNEKSSSNGENSTTRDCTR